MAEQSFPRDDVEYLAEDMRLFHAARSAGVINATGNDFMTHTSGMTITVQPGVACIPAGTGVFGHLIYALKDAKTFTLTAADNLLDRIDALIIRFSSQSNSCLLELVEGAKASNPARYQPVRNSNTYELVLKYIRVNHGVGALRASAITDCINDETLCGISDTLNKIPTDQIMAAFNAWFEECAADFENRNAAADEAWASFQQYLIDMKAEGDAEIESIQTDYAQQMNSFQTSQTTAFNSWFDSIKGLLDEDAAATLAAAVAENTELLLKLREMATTNRWEGILTTSDAKRLVTSDGQRIKANWRYVVQ